MNLNQFQEISSNDPLMIANAAKHANLVRQEFLNQVSKKKLEGVTNSIENYQNKEYIVFLKKMGRVDKIAIAWHIAPFGSEDLVVQSRFFEYAASSKMQSQAMGFLGVLGNMTAGFMSSSGRTWSNEVDLFKSMGQAVTGSGATGLDAQSRQEGQMIFMSLASALENAITKVLE